MSVFSKLVHEHTGNNHALTGGSDVEKGPYSQYTCHRLFLSAGDTKKAHLKVSQRSRLMVNGDRLIQSVDPVFVCVLLLSFSYDHPALQFLFHFCKE